MLDFLLNIEKEIPKLIINNEFKNSYVIDWVEPKEIRLWMQYDKFRISLQKIYPSNIYDAHYHNHPWYKAMKLIKGKALHNISYEETDTLPQHDTFNAYSSTKLRNNQLYSEILVKDSCINIQNPLSVYHQLIPLEEPAYFIMVTSVPVMKGPKAPKKEINKATIDEINDINNVILSYYEKSGHI